MGKDFGPYPREEEEMSTLLCVEVIRQETVTFYVRVPGAYTARGNVPEGLLPIGVPEIAEYIEHNGEAKRTQTIVYNVEDGSSIPRGSRMYVVVPVKQ